MKVIEQSYEIINEPNLLKRIELCGRVCYKSESKITEDSAERFVDMLVNRGNTSVLEHAQVRIPADLAHSISTRGGWGSELDLLKGYSAVYRMRGETEDRESYSVTNARDFLTLGGTLDELKELEHYPENFLTVRFITDRGVSHELVRHRSLSFSQESTRYVNYVSSDIQFVKPAHPMFESKESLEAWKAACEKSEEAYKHLVNECNVSPQEARAVLNNSVKTEIIVSGEIAWWKHMLYLRTTIGAHPQIRELMTSLNEEIGLV